MEQKKGNLWAGMTIFANYAIVLIITAFILFAATTLSVRELNVTVNPLLLFAIYITAVVLSIWLGVHSVKKVTPIDERNYLAISLIAALPVIALQTIVLTLRIVNGAPNYSDLANFVAIDALIVGLTFFFASRKSIAFKDNIVQILVIAAIVFLLGYGVTYFSQDNKYFRNSSGEADELFRKDIEEMVRRSIDAQETILSEEQLVNLINRDETVGVKNNLQQDKPFSPTAPQIQAETQAVASGGVEVISHPNGNIFSTCDGKPTETVPTTTMETDEGLILVREVSRYNPTSTDKYEINLCRGFIGWAPEGWFKDGKLEAYFRYDTGSQPLNVTISGQNRWGGLAPFKIDFSSFLSPARITQGTLIIIKADPNAARREINLNVETII